MNEEWIIKRLRYKFGTINDHVERLALAYEVFGVRGRDVLEWLEAGAIKRAADEIVKETWGNSESE